MAMYDWDGTTGSELGKVYDWDGTTSHQLGKGYDWDGTTSHLIYSAEQSYNDVSLSTMYVYGGNNKTNTNDTNYNMSGFDTLNISFSGTVKMTWSNGNGNGSSGYCAIRLNDNTIVKFHSFSGSLFVAGSTYGVSKTATVDLSSYTDTQKSSVDIITYFAVTGDSAKRMELTGTYSNIVAK